jgi:tryptophan-rich sensory protein
MNNGNSEWYKSLKKSKLTPPGWVISSVWAILYVMIIASGIIFLKNGGSVYSAGFFYYCVTWILNLSWSPIFFKYENLDLSFVVIVGMLVFITLNIWEFYNVSRLATYLLIPYMVWVSFATYLNGQIVVMNPKRQTEK